MTWVRDLAVEFFDRLCRVGHEMLPEKLSATIRFELAHDGEVDHWFMEIDRGRVRVVREDGPADCVMHAEKGLFDRLVTGEANLAAALFRNQVGVAGDLALLTGAVRKLFPGPPGAHDSRVAAG